LALEYAFNYSLVTSTIVNGSGSVPLGQPLPSSYYGYNPKLSPYTFNLTLAKQYLTESGVSLPVTLTFAYINSIVFESEEGLMFASTLQSLGITLQVVNTPWSTYTADVANATSSPDMVAVTQSGAYPDGDALLYSMWHTPTVYTWSQDPTHYSNATVDQLLNEERSSTNQTLRAQLMQQAQSIIESNAPAIFAFGQGEQTPYNKNLQGVTLNLPLFSYRAYLWTWSQTST